MKKVATLDSTPIDYKNALKVLEGSWITIEKQSGRDIAVAFANPSCRDFVLSFLDENPDYLEVLASDNVALRNVCNILMYAIAAVDDPPTYKFGGLRHYVKNNANELASVVARLFSREQRSEKFFSGTDVILGALLEVEKNLSLGWGDWLARAALDVGESDDRSYTVDFQKAYKVLALICSYARVRGGSLGGQNAFLLWFEACLESAQEDADWVDLYDFFVENDGLPELSSIDVKSMIKSAVLDSVESDLSNLHANYSGDPEGMRERIREIKSIASRVGIDDGDIASRIRWTEEHVADWFEEDLSGLADGESEDVDYSLRFVGGVSPMSAVSSSSGRSLGVDDTKRQLEEMFKQLS
ncbi:hypothetical protein [Allokutzneria sp. NRRL B-24872]|uniref:hypothetical protein n=1 Tax=Allokutzneria sp. NRRL B-24872 TaxID=1137961 RepID=UPI00117857BE|nr:hypothetical protein [Allokutzneria sp. NRRL B-24872]